MAIEIELRGEEVAQPQPFRRRDRHGLPGDPGHLHARVDERREDQCDSGEPDHQEDLTRRPGIASRRGGRL
jgi:hypothetical protein